MRTKGPPLSVFPFLTYMDFIGFNPGIKQYIPDSYRLALLIFPGPNLMHFPLMEVLASLWPQGYQKQKPRAGCTISELESGTLIPCYLSDKVISGHVPTDRKRIFNKLFAHRPSGKSAG